jgi:hypothetical protein
MQEQNAELSVSFVVIAYNEADGIAPTLGVIGLWPAFRDAGGRRGVWCPDRGFVIMAAV